MRYAKLSFIGHIGVAFEGDIGSMKHIFIPLALLVAASMPSASAMTANEARACNAMAASFGPKKADFEILVAERDRLVLVVEETGDAWEAAEALRNFSAQHAADADARKAAYDNAVVQFDAAEMAYRVTGAQLNEDFAAYNAKCATKD